MIGALYTTGDPAIWMNGLYPGPATEPGEKLASGNPVGPGTAVRVGLKSGAPWKLMMAVPNGFWRGVGLSSVTVCTQVGHPMPMLASFGAKFTPRSAASPESDASRRRYHTVSCCGVPLYATPW